MTAHGVGGVVLRQNGSEILTPPTHLGVPCAIFLSVFYLCCPFVCCTGDKAPANLSGPKNSHRPARGLCDQLPLTAPKGLSSCNSHTLGAIPWMKQMPLSICECGKDNQISDGVALVLSVAFGVIQINLL